MSHEITWEDFQRMYKRHRNAYVRGECGPDRFTDFMRRNAYTEREITNELDLARDDRAEYQKRYPTGGYLG